MLRTEINPNGFPAIDGVNVTRVSPRRKGPHFDWIDTPTLMSMRFDPIRWTVPGYLPEGFSVLAGRQKLGKTWLAIDWSAAVATGGIAMGSVEVEQGDVLYLDLENGQRRIQRRIRTLYPHEQSIPHMPGLKWVTDAPALDKGLIDALEDWRLAVQRPRLVVIDVLQKIKPAGKAAMTSYENDYTAWSPLQRWATQNGIAVLGLHHTRKGGADDPLEALSGSNGLSACADTTLVLDRDGNGITLYVRGRDVDEKEDALNFTSGLWTLRGDAAKVRMTSERQKVLEALKEADAPMSPAEIATASDMKRNNVDRLLGKMAKAGEVLKAKRGRYIHPERSDLTENNASDTPGKNGTKVRTDENSNENNEANGGGF